MRSSAAIVGLYNSAQAQSTPGLAFWFLLGNAKSRWSVPRQGKQRLLVHIAGAFFGALLRRLVGTSKVIFQPPGRTEFRRRDFNNVTAAL